MKNYSIEEKIYNLLKEIDEKRQITLAKEPVNIPFSGVPSRLFNNRETQTFLKKLEKDCEAISIIHISDGVIKLGQKSKYHGHHFNLTDKFDEYYSKIQEKVKKDKSQNSPNIKQTLERFSNQTIEDLRVLLNKIKYKNEITPKNNILEIYCEQHCYEEYKIDSEITQKLMIKLANDFKVIEIINFKKDNDPTGYGNFPLFKIKIIEERFFGFLDLVENQFKKLKGIKDIDSSIKNELKITYSEDSRQIILNDFFLIANPDFDSENERVFYYLYQNSNKNVTKSEIEENFNGNKTLTKSFNKIVENLNFQKDLRRAFFETAKDSIKFINPVSKERLKALNIQNIAIKAK